MNYLAHIYLSGDDELIAIGNFMADGIKGKNYTKYPPSIQTGILLHRKIDWFTDSHPIVRMSTSKLHKNYSHYASVIVDILYDHFLAKNWKDYCSIPLEDFTEAFYDSLAKNYDILPVRIKKLMPYMIADNWLLSYASVEGISKVLDGMNRRTKFVSGMNKAVNELREYYAEFETEFRTFFEELRNFSQTQLTQLTHEN